MWVNILASSCSHIEVIAGARDGLTVGKDKPDGNAIYDRRNAFNQEQPSMPLMEGLEKCLGLLYHCHPDKPPAPETVSKA